MALPPTSPRLPSPPPAAEIQIGPKSPAMPGATLAQQQLEQQLEQTILDANAKRRIHPGTRASDFAAGPPLVPLNELDSAFQLQEHLAALHYFHTDSNTRSISRDTALLLAQAPVGTDRTLWLYELCRFLIAHCNSLIIGFLFDSPPCSAATCPEMRASEWQFLCAVHEQPRSCCAIDYCCHTLDWAANVVTNPKIFPSRFAFADQHDKNAATKNLINVFRRLHRIFAHAWFQHRGVFWSVEGQTGLYVFFKTVCDMYDLLPAENYKLPPEAEGLDPAGNVPGPAAGGGDGAASAASAAGAAHAGATESTPGLISVASIADRKALGFGAGALALTNHRAAAAAGSSGVGALGSDLLSGEHSIGRTNTRRHIRSSPSTGSSVTTVLEQDEDSSLSPFAPARPMSILQHAERLSTPVSRAAAVPPPAPAPPTDAAEAEAAEQDSSVSEEAPAAADKEAKETSQDAAGPEAEAEADSTTAEEPVAEAADKEAEATEPIADAAADAATEETAEEPAKQADASEPEAAADEVADEPKEEPKEPTESTEPTKDAEPEAETETAVAAVDESSSSEAVPAPADQASEDGAPSTTAEAEPAGED